MLTSHNGESNSKPQRILVANDHEWTARSLESILTPEGFEVVRAYTGRQALGLAQELRPDLIILDFQLPDLSGPQVCSALRADPLIGWGTPIIITTAAGGRSRQDEALEAGAWDFRTQPFDGPALLHRVRTYLQAKAALDRALRQSPFDPESGLYSQPGLMHRLDELRHDVRRSRLAVTCIVVSTGSVELREASDQVRAHGTRVGNVLRSTLRGSDLLARLTPLDFAIIAPSVNADAALGLVDRLQHSLHQISGAPAGAPAAFRAGLASTRAEHSDAFDGEDLLRRAVAAVDWASPEDHPVTVAS